MQKLTITCAECRSRYQVPTTAAGKQVRCAKCGAAILVPAQEAAEADVLWYVSINGLQAAPVPKSTLDQCVGQGQMPPQALVRRSDRNEWQPITDLYPELVPVVEVNETLDRLMQAQQQQQPATFAPNGDSPYAAPQTTGPYLERRPPRQSGGLPGILIGMCVMVILFSCLGILLQFTGFSSDDDPTSQSMRSSNAQAYNTGRAVGITIDIALSISKILGAVLLLRRKASGRTVLRTATIISAAIFALAVALLLVGGAIAGMDAPFVAGMMIAGGFIGAYYAFVLRTLSREDVIAALD